MRPRRINELHAQRSPVPFQARSRAGGIGGSSRGWAALRGPTAAGRCRRPVEPPAQDVTQGAAQVKPVGSNGVLGCAAAARVCARRSQLASELINPLFGEHSLGDEVPQHVEKILET